LVTLITFSGITKKKNNNSVVNIFFISKVFIRPAPSGVKL
jgi:hypothetical protein